MTKISLEKKKDYINNRFHQYVDLSLNTNITTTETVNLVINIQDLFDKADTLSESTGYHHDIEITNDFNIQDVLNKYSDTEIEKEKTCVCTNVIDGNTIDVKIISESGTYIERIKLVGINTPEEGLNGYESSKKFLEKLCYSTRYFNHKYIKPEDSEVFNNKKIYLNIDKRKEYDEDGKLLAVLIVDNKNVNEILLKEKLAEMWYIPPSEFNPNDWKDPGTSIHLYNYKNDDLAILSPYIRPDFKNIVFTPTNDLNTLYNYEIYKGIIYVKLHPYSQYIRMHILPKAYDCSNQVLFFKDDLTAIKKNISKSDNYKVYESKNNINAYFQVNNKDRDRNTIVNKLYSLNEWEEEQSLDISKTFVEFGYDISEYTKSMNNLQICAGYRYNQTSPYYALHYTGIKDNNGKPEDRCTLIDANIDNIKGDSSNIITQMSYLDPDLSDPKDDVLYIKHDVEIKEEVGNNDHISNIGKLHHKTLKYINDLLYVEEEGIYASKMWFDPILITDYEIEIGEANQVRIKGVSEYAGKIIIHIDKDTENAFDKEILTSDFGRFDSGFFKYNPGEHTFLIEYNDPNSKYPRKQSLSKNILINKIPLNVDVTGFMKKREEEIHIDVKVLDFYNEPIKNKEINFSFKPGLKSKQMGYDLLFWMTYGIRPEDYNLGSFNATTNENGEISLIKKLDEIIINNSISPGIINLFGDMGAYELHLEFPSDEEYILENKKIYKEVSDINDLYNIQTIGDIYIVQK